MTEYEEPMTGVEEAAATPTISDAAGGPLADGPVERREQHGPGVFFVHLEPHSANQGQTLALAQALLADNWDAHIVCLASCHLAVAARELSLPVHTLPDGVGKGFFTAWRLLRILRKQGWRKWKKTGLLHACDPTASHVVSQAWRMNKKLRIVHTRRMPIMEPNVKAIRCYQTPSAKIITDSLAGKIALRLSGLEPHLLHTIACGIEPSEQPARLERGDGRIVFAITGPLMPSRGHSLLFDALAHLETMPDLPPWEVRVLGEGPFFQTLLEEARAKDILGHLAFLGGAGIRDQLCQCDVLVLPAVEGESHMPLVLQGWAAGLPIVAINRLDHAENFQDETNCLLVQPGDAVGLAHQMARLARDAKLRAHVAVGGGAALAKFAARTMVLEHKRLYGQILA